ncbi:hypothetical protein GCM10022220_65180 [Actinocatenispora rupis]|uniref:VOC domain-containing protein n=1 Tax=Actinocatenispora rupis TaxID=519421 RepID=A0A8J3J6J2_9ACTN|nr:hypothetical protein Aru02nite_66390 [Actinocatenispora rupis]
MAETRAVTTIEDGPEWQAAQAFLRDRGAAELAHPGGTLLAHLVRVARTLADWGAGPDVQLAGLCHAAYGTAGFDRPLLDVADRQVLADAIGAPAEALVHRYGSCDRDRVYPRLGEDPVRWHDRFTGEEHVVPEVELRAFAEITAANELDVLAHNAELAERYGPALRELLVRCDRLLSAPARAARDEALAVRVTALDHLVLTVADADRTTEFYRRVMGMRPVVFGGGRRALAFGSSKINLHVVGHEVVPHAARPTPGSADLCLLVDATPDALLAHLAACGVVVEEGPVPRTGARGPITSVYLRDPDGNLVELSSYPT